MSDSLPDNEPDESPVVVPVSPAAPAAMPVAPTGVPAGMQPVPSVPDSTPVRAAAVPAPAPTVDPVAVLKALADPVRYRVLKVMAGQPVTIAGLAKKLKVHPDTMGKHMKVLRRALVVRRMKSEDADGRWKLFHIPPACRPAPGVLDFGCCTLRTG